jgi:CheY-like chemotaxis protein
VSRRILVIDDSDLIRQVAELALRRAGWDVLTAGGGREGATLAAAEAPDAILLDVVMDDLDGPATLALLREREATRDIPVLFLTKPFDVASLAGDVSSTLGWDR